METENFWDPGNFRNTTKRIEDGFRLCNDIVAMIEQRCVIERKYAKGLQTWSKKWNDIISDGPEYGTTEAAWKAVLSEGAKLSQIHLDIKDRLTNEVIKDVKQWQKDNFHKTLMSIKEKKDIDTEFGRVQKPWARLLVRVNKAKLDYHNACKNEKTIKIQEQNSAADSSISHDQLKKIKERVQRAKEEVSKTRQEYEDSLQAINKLNPKYVQEMTQVFEKCQEFEGKRLNFFKDVLFDIHSCLNISINPELPLIYEEFRHTLQIADSRKDLKWWVDTHGVGMSMLWPKFEQFSEDFRDIIKDHKARKVRTMSKDGVTLINQHKFTEELPDEVISDNDANNNSHSVEHE